MDASLQYSLLKQQLFWDIIIAIASVVTATVAVFGLHFIRKTYEQTRYAVDASKEAVRVTNEVGFAQFRPWLSLEIVDIFLGYIDEKSTLNITFSVRLSNSGNSPATSVDLSSRLHLYDEDFNNIARGNEILGSRVELPTLGLSVAPHATIIENVVTTVSLPENIEIRGAIFCMSAEILAVYSDAMTSRKHFTHDEFTISNFDSHEGEKEFIYFKISTKSEGKWHKFDDETRKASMYFRAWSKME